MKPVEHIAATTFHGRRGSVRNTFRYGIDYVLVDLERDQSSPRLFSRQSPNLFSLRDRDHGGPPGHGRGAAWARDCLKERGVGHLAHRIELLAQPRVLGHVFNPVSFWLIRDRHDALRAVIAEVTNTFGDRYSYLCHRPDLATIGPSDRLMAGKRLHVSPFQEMTGRYTFQFDIRPDAIAIRIDYQGTNGTELSADLRGPRRCLTNRSILRACFRRPLGSRRVLTLIHWQAVKLWWKGASYRDRPVPPQGQMDGITECSESAASGNKGCRRTL